MALPAQVPRLSREQMAHLKLEGYVVLPAVLDPELLRQARDRLWHVLGQELPRMHRGEPSTWGPIEPGEPTGASEVPWPYESQPRDDSVKLFGGSGHRFYVHCAEERLFRNLFPLALHDVAEQLLGAGTVRFPAGPDADGLVRGPFFVASNGNTHKNLVGIKKYEHWVDKTCKKDPVICSV